MTKFVTRAFKRDDLVSVVNVENRAFHSEHYPGFFFVQMSEILSRTFLVAESLGGEVVGYGIGALSQSQIDVGWILSMGVLPDLTKQGIGTLIMLSLMEALKDLGVKTILLSVLEGNVPAVNLYTKLGFRGIEKLENYLGDGETRVIMKKNLE